MRQDRQARNAWCLDLRLIGKINQRRAKSSDGGTSVEVDEALLIYLNHAPEDHALRVGDLGRWRVDDPGHACPVLGRRPGVCVWRFREITKGNGRIPHGKAFHLIHMLLFWCPCASVSFPPEPYTTLLSALAPAITEENRAGDSIFSHQYVYKGFASPLVGLVGEYLGGNNAKGVGGFWLSAALVYELIDNGFREDVEEVEEERWQLGFVVCSSLHRFPSIRHILRGINCRAGNTATKRLL